jgi:hypothetical protein
MLQYDFGVQVDALPEHWIPLTIVGTLDWVVICGWWIFKNTGIFQSDDPYHRIFELDGYEFDPDKLLVFRDDPQRNLFEHRINYPGLDGKEKTETIPFIANDVFEVWWRHYHDKTPEEAETFFPPLEFIKYTIYCTFMWILDEYGRNWIAVQDEVLNCVLTHSVAYLCRWDNSLVMPPGRMRETNRPQNSCRYCEQTLWCVGGTTVGDKWHNVCNHCLIQLVLEGTPGLDEFETRIREPSCPHFKSVDGTTGSCMSTCPHSGMTQERVWEKLEEWGTGRQEEYRRMVREELGGMHPRQVAGQSIDDIVEHFRAGKGPGHRPPDRRRFRDGQRHRLDKKD